MQNTDRERFAELMDGLASVYGVKSLTPAAIEMYWQDLTEFSFCEVATAASRHRRDTSRGQFMPKPADLIYQLCGSDENRALLAWTKFARAAESVGAYRSVIFDDPALMAVVRDMGGWPRMASWQADEEPFLRKEFVTRYRGYLASKETPVSRLTGLHEMANRAIGFLDRLDADLVLVGAPEKCQRLLAAASSDRSPEVLKKLMAGGIKE